MSVTVYKATEHQPRSVTVFLAGTIDNGQSENWQARLTDVLVHKFKDNKMVNLTILNPRRDDWDTSASSDKMISQISWELDGLERADIVVVYFSPESVSPITLLELGLLLKSKPDKLLIFCSHKYFRHMNVLVTSARYGVDIYHDESEFMEDVANAVLMLS